ncbi:ABC transporter permease subunit [Candidatus Altiarchaeota archaeon]
MKKSLIIAKREIKSMLRERTLILVIMVELLLVIFSGLLNVGYVLLTSPEMSSELQSLNSFVAVGIVSNTPQPYTIALFASGMPYLLYDDLGKAISDFQDGLIDVVLVGDIDKTQNSSLVNIYIPKNSPKIDLIKLGVRTMFLRMEDDLRTEKIREYRPNISLFSVDAKEGDRSKEIEIYYIFTLPLLLFLPSLIAGSLVIDSITEDIENKTIINLLESPLTNIQIVAGKNLGALFICLTQSFAWLGILSFLELGIQGHLSLVFVSLLYTVIFTNLGSMVALKLKNLRNSQIMHTLLSMASISLFSPLANVSNQLVANSPSYIFTGLASGVSLFEFRFQIIFLILLATITFIGNFYSTLELEKIFE